MQVRLLEKFITKLKSDFKKNVLTLMAGTTIAQAIPIAISPILTRLYSPEEFGIAANFTVIVPLLVIVATGMYEKGILLCHNNKEAFDLIGFILLRSILILLAIELLIIMFGSFVTTYFGLEYLSRWLWLAPIASFGVTVTSVYSEWCIRQKYYSQLSKVKIINTSSVASSKLLFAFTSNIGNGLILGDVFGKVISAFSSAYFLVKNEYSLLKDIQKTNFKYLKKRFIDLPKFTMPDQLISNLGGSAPIILFGIYYTNTELGYFSISGSLLTVPITVFTISIKDVFRQRANEEILKYGNCKRIYVKVLKYISIIGLIGFSLLYFIIPDLIKVFLGKNWIPVGTYAQIQMPMFYLSFVSMSLSGILIIRNKMNVSFYWQIYYTITTILSIIIGVNYFKSIEDTMILLVIFRSSSYMLYMILSYHYTK